MQATEKAAAAADKVEKAAMVKEIAEKKAKVVGEGIESTIL